MKIVNSLRLPNIGKKWLETKYLFLLLLISARETNSDKQATGGLKLPF